MPPVVVDGEHETGRTRPAGDHVVSLGDLPDDIVAAVLVDVAAAADRPGDLLSVQEVLFAGLVSKRRQECISWSLSIPAKSWCPGAKIFLQRCEEAGSIDASFMLGMILFYCLKLRDDIPAAVGLCQQAASNGHVIALRELGFCTHDGYSISQDHQEGHRLVDLAKSLEI
ncbi:hypothetical protein QYE76_034341 [Lolium multiflorum]|uniref:F-box protein n=1 Tax=Lolium multiflorum TaxID=4521 RepID=A0AAD8VN86_LOLMU|nr:hypothetical protein QYE76_034341 [Lolium multiflorum]